MITPRLRVHRAACVAALQAGPLPGDAEERIGSGEPPDDTSTPYAVVYGRIAGYDGPAADPHADCEFEAQVKCVGATDDEAEGLHDAVIALLSNISAWTVPGRSVSQPMVLPSPSTFRDDDLEPPLFSTDAYVRVPTSPA